MSFVKRYGGGHLDDVLNTPPLQFLGILLLRSRGNNSKTFSSKGKFKSRNNVCKFVPNPSFQVVDPTEWDFLAEFPYDSFQMCWVSIGLNLAHEPILGDKK